MNHDVICVRQGPDRGIWFESEQGLLAFMNHPKVKEMPEAAGLSSLAGLPVRVASPQKWRELCLKAPLASPPAAAAP